MSPRLQHCILKFSLRITHFLQRSGTAASFRFAVAVTRQEAGSNTNGPLFLDPTVDLHNWRLWPGCLLFTDMTLQ